MMHHDTHLSNNLTDSFDTLGQSADSVNIFKGGSTLSILELSVLLLRMILLK